MRINEKIKNNSVYNKPRDLRFNLTPRVKNIINTPVVGAAFFFFFFFADDTFNVNILFYSNFERISLDFVCNIFMYTFYYYVDTVSPSLIAIRKKKLYF